MIKGLDELEAIGFYPTDYDGKKYTRIKDEFGEEFDIIEKELKDKEELEKAFVALSKEDEKTKKLLSLEIEKNRKLQIIEEKFDIEVFEMKDLDEKVEYIIDIKPKQNKHSNMSGNSLTQEEYESILGK